MRIASVLLMAGLMLLSAALRPAARADGDPLSPTITQALLGPGHEQFWVAGGSKPKSIDTIKRQIAVLEGNVAKVNPAYAEPLRALREQLTATTTLTEYQALARTAVDKVKELETTA